MKSLRVNDLYYNMGLLRTQRTLLRKKRINYQKEQRDKWNKVGATEGLLGMANILFLGLAGSLTLSWILSDGIQLSFPLPVILLSCTTAAETMKCFASTTWSRWYSRCKLDSYHLTYSCGIWEAHVKPCSSSCCFYVSTQKRL